MPSLLSMPSLMSMLMSMLWMLWMSRRSSDGRSLVSDVRRFSQEIGAIGAGHDDVHKRTDGQVVGQDHESVDFGSLPVGPSLAGGVHQYLDPGADQLIAAVGGNGILELGAFT